MKVRIKTEKEKTDVRMKNENEIIKKNIEK